MPINFNRKNINQIYGIIILVILSVGVYQIVKRGIKADEVALPGATYSGTITSTDSKPIEGVFVKFDSSAENTPVAVSAKDGKYSVNVPKGNYHVILLTKDGQQDIESPISVTDEDIGTTQTFDFPGIVSEPFEITSEQAKTTTVPSADEDTKEVIPSETIAFSSIALTSPTQNQTFTKIGTCPSCNVAIPVAGTVRAGGTATISKVEAFKGTQLMKTFSLPSGGLTTWDFADTIGIGNPSTSTFSLVFKATFSDNSTVSSDPITVTVN